LISKYGLKITEGAVMMMSKTYNDTEAERDSARAATRSKGI